MTGREVAVLELIADGHSTRTAARRLSCSPRTIKKHLEHAYRKLGVRDRLNAIRVARLAGVVADWADTSPSTLPTDAWRKAVGIGLSRSLEVSPS